MPNLHPAKLPSAALFCALALSLAAGPPARLPVAVVAGPQAEARRTALASGPDLAPRVLPGDQARQELARGHVVLVVSADDIPSYIYDPTQPESRAARLAVDAALQRAAGRTDAFTPGENTLTEPGARYVDFLVPEDKNVVDTADTFPQPRSSSGTGQTMVRIGCVAATSGAHCLCPSRSAR
jgi:hypothetical protein